MTREYEPLFPRSPRDDRDLEAVRERLAAASARYLAWPWGWAAWAVLLPLAALATPGVTGRFGPAGVLALWSATILAGGAGEALGWRRRGDGEGPSGLAAWVLRAQGNLSLIAVALTALLVARDEAWAIPAVWLLLVGHSLWAWGGLAFRPLRRCGLLYQVGGIVALWPGPWALPVFAIVTCLGNAEVARGIIAARRRTTG